MKLGNFLGTHSPSEEPRLFAKESPTDVLWGRMSIPISEATGHFMAVGSTGSGKTTMLRILMQSALRRIGKASDQRALIYDAKQDVLPLLAAIASNARVVTTHPFDARGARWDIAADVREPTVAMEIAYTLIPNDADSQPFFPNASRHLLYGVMLSFMLTGKPWTFATLVRAMRRPERIRSILLRHRQTRDLVKQYFYDSRLVANIMSTVATKLLPFEPIAAAWESARDVFSLEEWVRGDWILVLSNYESSRTAIDTINRCIFKRASDLTLNLPNSTKRRTWFVLDEVSDVGGHGGLPGLGQLAKKGRSKGAAIVLSFQSISSLRDPRSFGPNVTDEVLGQIANRWFGRLECLATAEWASNLFGDHEHPSSSVTMSYGSSGGQSVSQSVQMRRLVLPSELMSIEPCNRENGLAGYYIVRSHGAYSDHLPGDELFDRHLINPCPHTPEFIPRPITSQYLAPWTRAEEEAFGTPKMKRNTHSREGATQSSADTPRLVLEDMSDLDASFG